MQLKKIPEDFIVNEVPNREFPDEGNYLICLMKKKNYNTEDAVWTLCKALGTSRKNISYSGTKDRNAITTQHISLFKGTPERIKNIELKDISLEIVGRSKAPLSLGDLKGNNFEIVVRDLEENTEINKIDKFPNYFDKQRFSFQNVDIGRAILKRDFKEACKLILTDKKYGPLIKETLDKEKHNYAGALQKIPHKILLIYLHAFQSMIWNKTVQELIEKKIDKKEVPLVGFSDIEDCQEIIGKLLEEEKLTQRDFIIREFPEISLEGSQRKPYAEIKDLEVGKLEDDELNMGKKKVLIKFFLEKGAYATMAVKYIIKC